MRVIAGKAGGLPLKTPKTNLRPTTDRAREAVFSSLGERVVGAAVLDLYAGGGGYGIEALSRGAASAVFVESHREACRAIGENLAATRLENGRVREETVSAFLSRSRREPAYDLVFADPPYARGEAEAEELGGLLADEALPALLAGGGLFVLETRAGGDLPPAPSWHIERTRRYGAASIHYLVKKRD
ncbi:MAG: 16S rRNA (guanine(966)-N(2))-methyltransferase RsmD [Verrucomicrobiae bacterium]|nr:16S rRNA (guanine(966)-N(2))-methyltransferase RsmD [Verrucomicrobiae bacterium]MCP5540379.1 16S rRNA (guanine(966)-N(2))-methyltransferase RsmD [Akkermansiaceae bacterium]